MILVHQEVDAGRPFLIPEKNPVSNFIMFFMMEWSYMRFIDHHMEECKRDNCALSLDVLTGNHKDGYCLGRAVFVFHCLRIGVMSPAPVNGLLLYPEDLPPGAPMFLMEDGELQKNLKMVEQKNIDKLLMLVSMEKDASKGKMAN